MQDLLFALIEKIEAGEVTEIELSSDGTSALVKLSDNKIQKKVIFLDKARAPSHL